MAKSVLVWAALAVAVAENCAAALLQTQSTATLHMAQMRPSARNCVKLFEDVCDFKVEDQEHRFVCQYEHATRPVKQSIFLLAPVLFSVTATQKIQGIPALMIVHFFVSN
eukprot:s3731_g12.t1